jgi:small subunit ribosomal protein S21
MQALARTARGLWPPTAAVAGSGQVQPSRGIMVQVRDGNLERALQVMERKMRSSGIERLIKRRTEHHVKNSEKRVLAHKALMARVRSQELGKKLREILIKKIRSVSSPPTAFALLYYDLMRWLLAIIELASGLWAKCSTKC